MRKYELSKWDIADVSEMVKYLIHMKYKKIATQEDCEKFEDFRHLLLRLQERIDPERFMYD